MHSVRIIYTTHFITGWIKYSEVYFPNNSNNRKITHGHYKIFYFKCERKSMTKYNSVLFLPVLGLLSAFFKGHKVFDKCLFLIIEKIYVCVEKDKHSGKIRLFI